jgi:hypothetical protein
MSLVPSPDLNPVNKPRGKPDSKNLEVANDAIPTPERRKQLHLPFISPRPGYHKLGKRRKHVDPSPNRGRNREPKEKLPRQQSRRRANNTDSGFQFSGDSNEDESEGFESSSGMGGISGSESYSEQRRNRLPSEEGLNGESQGSRAPATIGNTIISAMQEGLQGDEGGPCKPKFEPMSMEER